MTAQLNGLDIETLFDYQQHVNYNRFYYVLRNLKLDNLLIDQLWSRFMNLYQSNLLLLLHNLDSRIVEAILKDIRQYANIDEPQTKVTVEVSLYFSPNTSQEDAETYAETWKEIAEEQYLIGQRDDDDSPILEHINSEVKRESL